MICISIIHQVHQESGHTSYRTVPYDGRKWIVIQFRHAPAPMHVFFTGSRFFCLAPGQIRRACLIRENRGSAWHLHRHRIARCPCGCGRGGARRSRRTRSHRHACCAGPRRGRKRLISRALAQATTNTEDGCFYRQQRRGGRRRLRPRPLRHFPATHVVMTRLETNGHQGERAGGPPCSIKSVPQEANHAVRGFTSRRAFYLAVDNPAVAGRLCMHFSWRLPI